MADTVLGLFQGAGITNARADGGARRVPADLRRDRGSARLAGRHALRALRRAAGAAGAGLDVDPWTPTKKDDGRVYGRGAADDKGGLAITSARCGASTAQPPCTRQADRRGDGGDRHNLEAFVEAHPDCSTSTCSSSRHGQPRVGEPVLTTTLRGDVACIVTVSTLEHPLHSGVFGGAAPDAMMALARLLATLHDDDGNVAVDGVTRSTGTASTFGGTTSRTAPTCSTARRWSGAARSRITLWAQPVGLGDRDRHDRRSTAPRTC